MAIRTIALFSALAITAIGGTAHAQGYIIHQPGQMPSYANPTPNGGWMVTQPGQMPMTVTPSCGFGACQPAWRPPQSPMDSMIRFGR